MKTVSYRVIEQFANQANYEITLTPGSWDLTKKEMREGKDRHNRINFIDRRDYDNPEKRDRVVATMTMIQKYGNGWHGWSLDEAKSIIERLAETRSKPTEKMLWQEEQLKRLASKRNRSAF